MHYVFTNGEETQILQEKDAPEGFRLLGTHKGKVPVCARWDAQKGKLVDCDETKKHRDREHNRGQLIDELEQRVERLEELVAELTSGKK